MEEKELKNKSDDKKVVKKAKPPINGGSRVAKTKGRYNKK